MAAIPERLIGVALTACPGPMDVPGALRGMKLVNRSGVLLAQRPPRLFAAGCRLVGGAARRHPGFFYEKANRDKPSADRRWLHLPDVRRDGVETICEAPRTGTAGYLRDIALLVNQWGFSLRDVRLPVRLWQGDLDTVVPLHHARHLAFAIPRADLRVCPGEGHMLMWNHLPEVLAAATGETHH